MTVVDGYNLEQKVGLLEEPTLLFKKGEHEIYWLGISEKTVFRCNVYLIKDQDKGWIVDSGSRETFELVKQRVEQVMPLNQLEGLIYCHQDPDVAASVVDWLKFMPSLTVMTTPRTQVLLNYFGVSGYPFINVTSSPTLELPSGAKLTFIGAPFLHSPGAFATYDDAAHSLFSGDIWAALDVDWQLYVTDFEMHRRKMDLFHKYYMASNIAARGFVRCVDKLPLKAILPQHGSLMAGENVEKALQYLRELRCGTDLVYADLELQ
jgi:flavorubredoxin